MKISFDIKFRPQIESGEYKVETRDGKPARILCWDKVDEYGQYIVALVQYTPDHENMISACEDGIYNGTYGHGYDLFIVTPEEEMSDFVKEYFRLYKEGYADGQAGSEQLSDAILKVSAAELLSLARDQFIKDGYVIEKKAFHDAVENISDKHRAEMSVEYSIHCKVEDGTRHAIMNWEEFQKVAQKFIDIGKAEALKDLPRWYESRGVFSDGWINDGFLYYMNHSIQLSSLEKLPGFKEDEK